MEITFITPLTRPENLQRIFESILEAASGMRWHWMIIEDAENKSKLEFPNTYHMAYQGEGLSGNPQRNKALDLLIGYTGYIYFLDDDNIVHPNLLVKAETRLGNTNKALIVSQMWSNGVVRLVPRFEAIAPCQIDTAQFILPYEMIGDLRWQAGNYCADGEFFSALFKKHQSKFIIAPGIFSYYNYLGKP